MTSKAAVVPFHCGIVGLFGPGERCEELAPGDMMLVRDSGPFGVAIRCAERIRTRDAGEWSWVNHACIVVEGPPTPYVAQMDAHGEVLTPIGKLDALSYAVLRAYVEPPLINMAVLFVEEKIGSDYSWAQIPADLFNASTGLELSLGWGDHMVCSTQSTRSWERLGYVPGRSPYAQTPAHLARDFGVSRSLWRELPSPPPWLSGT